MEKQGIFLEDKSKNYENVNFSKVRLSLEWIFQMESFANVIQITCFFLIERDLRGTQLSSNYKVVSKECQYLANINIYQ